MVAQTRSIAVGELFSHVKRSNPVQGSLAVVLYPARRYSFLPYLGPRVSCAGTRVLCQRGLQPRETVDAVPVP